MGECLAREYHFSIRLNNRVRIALCSCSFTSSGIGTRFTSPYTPNTAFASFGVTQRAWYANLHDRPGLTNARATNRTPPFSMLCLHDRHLAREVGAVPTQYLLARVRKPGVRRISFCLSLSWSSSSPYDVSSHIKPARPRARTLPQKQQQRLPTFERGGSICPCCRRPSPESRTSVA